MVPAILAARFDVDALDRDESTNVAIDPAGTILWVNRAWERFATANGGADVLRRFGLGGSYLGAISPSLQGFYASAFSNALASGEPLELDYECSSAETFRRFHMRGLPIGQEGLLLEHSLVVEHPHDRAVLEPIDALYASPDGVVVQCSNCRRVRRTTGLAWDWVPAWVRSFPPRTSHGLCDSCRAFYWG